MDKTFKIKKCAVRLSRVNTSFLQQIVQELSAIEAPRIRNCAVRLQRCYLPVNVNAATNGINGHHASTNGIRNYIRNGVRSEKSMTPILSSDE